MTIVAAGSSQTFTSSGNLEVRISLQGGSSGYYTLDGKRTDLSTGNALVKAATGSVIVLVCYTGIVTYTSTDSGASTSSSTAQRTLFTTRTLTTADSGAVLEVAASATLTVPPNLGVNFSCAVDVVGGTATIATTGGSTTNGSATSITRSARQMFSISQCLTNSPNDYTVTGS